MLYVRAATRGQVAHSRSHSSRRDGAHTHSGGGIAAKHASQCGITPPRSSAKASLTLARLLQPLRDRGPVRTNAYTYTVQRSSLLPVEKRELVADKLHTGHAVELKRTQSKPRGSCRRSRGRKRGVALRRHLATSRATPQALRREYEPRIIHAHHVDGLVCRNLSSARCRS